jgi:hypothetical protein
VKISSNAGSSIVPAQTSVRCGGSIRSRSSARARRLRERTKQDTLSVRARPKRARFHSW